MQLVATAAAVLGLNTAASANVGTPLMHTSACFLLVLNLFIGWIEGEVIAERTGAPRGRAIMVMIVANYVSAWSGVFLLAPLGEWLRISVFSGPPLYTAGWVLGTLIVASLAASLMIEAPFALTAGWYGRGVKATAAVFVAVQTLTHTAVIGMFMLVSPITLLTQLDVERDLGFVPGSLRGAWVYYIGEDRSTVWRARLDGATAERVADIGEADPLPYHGAVLYAMPNESGEGWDLWITGHPARRLIEQFARRPGVFYESRAKDEPPSEPRSPTWLAADLRPEDDRPWLATTGWFAEEGLQIEHPGNGQHRSHRITSFAFAHAFSQWRCRSATVLPGGLVVVEFSPAQILVIDVEGRKAGVLARGYGPVVVLENGPAAE